MLERLLALAAGVNADECPFNDPHTAAPHLWLLRRLDGTRLECSCATIAGDMQVLRGTEDMLLWRHRIETDLSTEANYGLFYPGYARPTNRWIARGRWSDARTLGRRAVPLTEHSTPNDFSVSRPALQGPADLLDAHWWQRVPLSDAPFLPIGPAVFCVYDHGEGEPVYVGETSDLPAGAASHAAAPWPAPELWLAYLSLPQGTPKHVLHELESDLLGWHFWRTCRAPAAQCRGRPRHLPPSGEWLDDPFSG